MMPWSMEQKIFCVKTYYEIMYTAPAALAKTAQ